MKRLSYIYLFIFLFFFPKMVDATHLIGGNIQYRCLGGNDYEINLYIYSDCNGVPLPATAFINLASTSCALNQNIQLNKINTTDVSAICPSVSSSCNGSTGAYGFNLHHYSDTITIPTACPDWVISYSTCCRYGSTNLQNASSSSLYFETTLDNQNIVCNSSPVFQSELRLLGCINQPFHFSFAAYDADGDSLAYSLANPLAAGGTPIAYNTGYSPIYPFSASGSTIDFDSRTGEVSFTPDILQNGYYDVLVEEYRNGIKIGEARQAAALTVTNCTANSPVVLDEVIHVRPNGQALSLGANPDFTVCSGQTLEFWMLFSDADPTDVIQLDSIETSILEYYPQAILQSYYPHSAIGQFDSCWLYIRIPQMDLGIFNLAMTDDHCPLPHIQNFAILVEDLGSCAQLRGQLQADLNNNCIAEANEFGIEGAIIKLENSVRSYHAITDADGNYSFSVDPGNYTLSLVGPNPIWQVNCQNNIPINLSPASSVQDLDIQLSPQAKCPALKTDISTPYLQACSPATYSVYYQNFGTDTAFNAYIEIELDSFLSFVSSDLAVTLQNGSLYRFNLGHLPPMQKGYFNIETILSCQSNLIGRTHCVSAHIYPDTFCYTHPNWNGVDLSVEGSCDSDSIRFYVHNQGVAMPSKSELIIIEDDIIFLLDSIQLNNNDSIYFAVETNGSTWRLQTKQGNGHPWSKLPNAVLEGCVENNGDPFSTGYLTQFPEDDGAAFLSHDCQENAPRTTGPLVRSYPKGYGSANYVDQEQRLEYHFRFENVSADTLFQMRIRDSLGQNLEVTSLRAGSASQPFHWELIEEDILRIWLDSLYLPNNQTDSLGSSGFIKFELVARPNLALGTQITPLANSYSNYQNESPFNNIFQTIGDDYILSALIPLGKKSPEMTIKVYPNPFKEFFYLEFESDWGDKLSFQLLNALGQVIPVKSQRVSSNQYQMEANELASGYYLLQIFEGGKLLAVAKLLH